MADIPLAEVEPGDLAWHIDGYDPRRVTELGSEGIYLELFGSEIGPCPAENYTFTRDH